MQVKGCNLGFCVALTIAIMQKEGGGWKDPFLVSVWIETIGQPQLDNESQGNLSADPLAAEASERHEAWPSIPLHTD